MNKNKTKSTTYHCIYHKNKNGMGGVAIPKTDAGGLGIKDKINITSDLENFALDNDEVAVAIYDTQHEYLQGEIVNIIKHNTTNLVGFAQSHKPHHLLRVNNPKFGNYLVVIKTAIDKVDRDQLLNSVITGFPNAEKPFFEVELSNSIGKKEESHSFIEEILIEAKVPVEFSKSALSQAEKLPHKVLFSETMKHTDLRHIPFVTIDGEDAKDFDDAVYCESTGNTFTLYVAIADVAHYVTPGSPLDDDAYSRGTSIYFPNRVIPMLPENLSNGLCSLNPNVDRLVICCQMEITQDGDIINYQIFDAIIHSQARLTYTQVHDWINDLATTPQELISNISNLYLVYKALLVGRDRRGAIDFDTVEPVFDFDDKGMVSEIIPRIRLESHKLIEECMLAANVSVADFLIKRNHPTLFRIHEKPSIEKFTTLKNYLNSLAITFNVEYEHLTPRDYTRLLHQVRDHIDFETIQNTVLRSMQLAVYSPNNIGHFGLSYHQYLHFTSPIRRYPDLLVHRAIKNILYGTKETFREPLAVLGEHTSFAERRSEDLERKVDSFYKCQYAKNHIGSEFDGYITTVVNFGVFVHIPRLMIDGLIHISELGEDYFVLNERTLSLIGKSSGMKYSPGQQLHVCIAGVDMAKLFVDLRLVV